MDSKRILKLILGGACALRSLGVEHLYQRKRVPPRGNSGNVRVPGNRNFCGCPGPVVGRPERAERRLPRRTSSLGQSAGLRWSAKRGPCISYMRGPRSRAPDRSYQASGFHVPVTFRPQAGTHGTPSPPYSSGRPLLCAAVMRRGYLPREYGIHRKTQIQAPREFTSAKAADFAIDAEFVALVARPGRRLGRVLGGGLPRAGELAGRVAESSRAGGGDFSSYGAFGVLLHG